MRGWTPCPRGTAAAKPGPASTRIPSPPSRRRSCRIATTSRTRQPGEKGHPGAATEPLTPEASRMLSASSATAMPADMLAQAAMINSRFILVPHVRFRLAAEATGFYPHQALLGRGGRRGRGCRSHTPGESGRRVLGGRRSGTRPVPGRSLAAAQCGAASLRGTSAQPEST